jgi:hypothetical protein
MSENVKPLTELRTPADSISDIIPCAHQDPHRHDAVEEVLLCLQQVECDKFSVVLVR